MDPGILVRGLYRRVDIELALRDDISHDRVMIVLRAGSSPQPSLQALEERQGKEHNVEQQQTLPSNSSSCRELSDH